MIHYGGYSTGLHNSSLGGTKSFWFSSSPSNQGPDMGHRVSAINYQVETKSRSVSALQDWNWANLIKHEPDLQDCSIGIHHISKRGQDISKRGQ
jgi:hypothetical protein